MQKNEKIVVTYDNTRHIMIIWYEKSDTSFHESCDISA